MAEVRGRDRRRHKRVLVDFRALIPGAEGYHSAKALNISKSGVVLEVNGLTVSEGEGMTVLIKAPQKITPVLVRAKVRWAAKEGEQLRMGLEFQNLSLADFELLEEIIEEAEKGRRY